MQCGPGVQSALPAVAFEREPGAASAAYAGSYQRRRPETTVLYRVVREHLNTFLSQAEARSSTASGFPAFIEREYRRYLDCGILSKGFSRLRCPRCKTERLVAFSCKGRMCPSCWARRAASTAADLVGRQLPMAPYRQWVLTFPWELRFKLAVDKRFLSKVLRAFLLTLFAWQRRRGRQLGFRGQTGAVTFVQRLVIRQPSFAPRTLVSCMDNEHAPAGLFARTVASQFGGALNLNPHFHSLLPDGLFIAGDNGQLRFQELPAPTDDEVGELLDRLVCRIQRLFCATRRGSRP